MANESGGYRYDFTARDNIKVGENRTIQIPIEDASGTAIDSFTGYEFELFIISSLSAAEGLDALRASNMVHKQDADITATAPNVDIPLVPGDLESTGQFAFELWRVDTGNVRNLSYGNFPVIS